MLTSFFAVHYATPQHIKIANFYLKTYRTRNAKIKQKSDLQMSSSHFFSYILCPVNVKNKFPIKIVTALRGIEKSLLMNGP